MRTALYLFGAFVACVLVSVAVGVAARLLGCPEFMAGCLAGSVGSSLWASFAQCAA